MKKYFIVLALFALAPSIAFASWWNPLSWNWTDLFNSPIPVSAVIQNPVATTSASIEATTSITETASTTRKSYTLAQLLQMGAVPNNIPTINSFSNDIITGKNFNGVTDVYLYSIPALSGGVSQRIDLNYVPVSNTEIDLEGKFNTNYTDQSGIYYFNLYVVNAAGISKPVGVSFGSSNSSQTATTPLDCYAAGMAKELQTLNNGQSSGLSSEDQAMEGAQESANLLSYQNTLADLCNVPRSADQQAQQEEQAQNAEQQTQQIYQNQQQETEAQQEHALQVQQEVQTEEQNAQLQQLQQMNEAQQAAQEQARIQQEQEQMQQEEQIQQESRQNCSLSNLIQSGMSIPGCN